MRSPPPSVPSPPWVQRLLAELHDGVGSRLLALATSMDLDDAMQRHLCIALHDCLLDLHRTMDGLDADGPATVSDQLGRLRHRIQPAVGRLGIRLLWACDDEADPGDADASEVCKIAQEALSNVLRHSHAGQVAVRWGWHGPEGRLCLDVIDDGVGIAGDALATTRGRGLRGMQARAHRLGGRLWVEAVSPHGTQVRLVLPSPPRRR